MIPKNKKQIIIIENADFLKDFDKAFPDIVDYSDDIDDIEFQDYPDFWDDPAHNHD